MRALALAASLLGAALLVHSAALAVGSPGSPASTPSTVSCDEILVVDATRWSGAEGIAALSIQGIVNRQGPILYLVHSPSELVLARIAVEDLLSCPFKVENLTFWDIVELYKRRLRGVIVYDPQLPDTVNLAYTLAGLYDAVVASPDLAVRLEAIGLKVIRDLRGAYNNKLEVYREVLRLLPKLDPSAIALLQPGRAEAADYAVKHRIAVVNLSALPEDSEERELLESILSGVTGYMALGFPPGGGRGEYYGVRLLSRYGKTLVVGDHASSLSFTEWLPHRVSLSSPEAGPPPLLPDGVYAAIILSDGDNIGFLQHILPSEAWWGNRHRGSFPLAWTINPLLSVLAPNIAYYLDETASPNDTLVSGVAGAGHLDPTVMPRGALERLAREVGPLARELGFDVAVFWDPLGYKGLDAFKGVYRSFYPVVSSSVEGLRGFTVWEGRPVIYTVYVDSYEDYRSVLEGILRVKVRPLLLALYVNVWSFQSLDRVAELAETLKSMGVKLVSPRQLAELALTGECFLEAPWYQASAGGGLLELRLAANGSPRLYLYSRYSGSLLAVLNPNLLLKDSHGVRWVSLTPECGPGCSGERVVLTYREGGVTIERTYTVAGPAVEVTTRITGYHGSVGDVLLDELDTLAWGTGGPTPGAAVMGPRYLYAPSLGVVERPLEPETYHICSGCGELIVFDSSYPYPHAVAVAFNDTTPDEVVDAFNPGGDMDGDGVGEYHALLAWLHVEGSLTYTYYIIPLDHAWTLRLPPEPPGVLAEQILEPNLEEILGGLSHGGWPPTPPEVTVTTTVTATYTVTETVTHTVTVTTTVQPPPEKPLAPAALLALCTAACAALLWRLTRGGRTS